MNIAALMGTSGALSEQAGATPVSLDGVEGDFKQLLHTLVSEMPDQGNEEMIVDNGQNANWLGMLLQLFDNVSVATETLDPTGEAEIAQNQASVSLTEIMTALQPLVDQSETTTLVDPSLLATNQDATAPATSDSNTSVDITTLTHLSGLISGTFTPTAQPTSSAQPSLTGQVTPEPGATPLPAALTQTGAKIGMPVETGTAQKTQPAMADGTAGQNQTTQSTAQNAQALPSASQTESPLAKATHAPPASSTPNFNDLLNASQTPATTTEKTPATQPVNTTSPFTVANQPTSQSQVEPQTNQTTAEQPVSLAADVTSATVSVHNASQGKVSPGGASGLPNVPALQQIVDSVKFITQQGQTQVHLQLHPKELGKVLVQLNVVDGDVTVRMLAETVQAQALIHEHLPQLKATFTAQGLQVNNLQIDVGSGQSSFDTSGRQPQDGQAGQPGYSGPTGIAIEEPAAPSATQLRPGQNNLYSIDYHV